MSDIGGVWRTVGGRRIFIKDGEDLQTAMKKSGKFNSTKGLTEEGKKKIKELEKDEEHKKSLNDFLENAVSKENQLTDKEIRDIKSQKSLKTLVDDGRAKDITRLDDTETRKLDEKHGRLERVKVIHGTYGMNGALLQSNKTGEYFVITARNSNLFYWV